ncbi:MAG: hypothetical protein J6A59_01040, partial [Lachnospiraceae bacterium]|nr:hypothetical protein [Lachnospiraceae bacterium]
MKRRLTLVLLVLAMVLTLISCSSEKETTEEIKIEVKDTDLNENITVSDNLFDLEIAIDGVKYKFPEQMQKIVDAGWVVSETQDIDNITKEDKLEVGLNYIHKKYPNVTTYFKFDTEKDNTETVGMSMYINDITGAYPDYPDIKLAQGITFGTSLEDTREILGEPYGMWVTEDCYILPYEDRDAGVHFTFSITESFGVIGIDFYKVR